MITSVFRFDTRVESLSNLGHLRGVTTGKFHLFRRIDPVVLPTSPLDSIICIPNFRNRELVCFLATHLQSLTVGAREFKVHGNENENDHLIHAGSDAGTEMYVQGHPCADPVDPRRGLPTTG
jgi:hypothetical protein